MNIYRSKRTGRLVTLALVKPPRFTGSWHETEDLRTGEVRKLRASEERSLENAFTLVAQR